MYNDVIKDKLNIDENYKELRKIKIPWILR